MKRFLITASCLLFAVIARAQAPAVNGICQAQTNGSLTNYSGTVSFNFTPNTATDPFVGQTQTFNLPLTVNITKNNNSYEVYVAARLTLNNVAVTNPPISDFKAKHSASASTVTLSSTTWGLLTTGNRVSSGNYTGTVTLTFSPTNYSNYPPGNYQLTLYYLFCQ